MAISETPSPLARVISTKTYNAQWFQATGFTSEQSISAAIAAAAKDYPTGGAFVYVPASMFPYTIGSVTLNPLVALVQESAQLAGYGAPEGVYPAPVGWLYQQLNTADLWQKTTGTGTTGWSEIVGALQTTTNKIVAVTNRYIDMIAFPLGQNNGDSVVVNNHVQGYSHFMPTVAATEADMFAPLASSTIPVLNLPSDGGRAIQWFTANGFNVCYASDPAGTSGAGGLQFFLPFYGTAYPTTTGTITTAGIPAPSTGLSCSISAWVRKVNAGDGSDCRMTIGFGCNQTVSLSSTVPRVGLIGDGAGGYRYGSVNCPDGAAAGANAATDRGANSVQPADLVDTGAAWWHMRIKLIPATPTTGGKIACYHNGVLVATFTTTTNMPRGNQAVSSNFNRVQCSIYNFSGDGAIHVPELLTRDLRVVMEDDLTT